MKPHTVIKLIMRRYGADRKQVANKLGAKNEKTLFTNINSDRFDIDHMVTILDALGYQLVFQPKGSETLPEWSYPIRWADYQETEE